MSETIEGVDLSPDRDVRVSWNMGLVDLMTHTSVSPLRKRYPPAHWNPDPMFGLRTPHDWFLGEWRAGNASYGGSFVYVDGNYINRTQLQHPATTPESP